MERIISIKTPAGAYPTGVGGKRTFILLLLFLAEASFVGNNLPALFFADRSWNERNHSGARTAIFDDPHEFSVFSFFMEFAIGEIPGPWVEHFPRRTVPITFFPVTVNTGTFS